jgi:hypothetical protein
VVVDRNPVAVVVDRSPAAAAVARNESPFNGTESRACSPALSFSGQ